MDAPQELAAYPELEGFRLIQELGRSPKGIVYKARRLVEQDIVAVKVFRDAIKYEPEFRASLPRHAEATFLLEHPGLVRCLGCHEDQNRLLLVMEYARGEPLSRALQRNVRFLPPRALGIAMQCAEALHYAYQRHRTHGRLHPGDIILGEDEVRVLNPGLGEHPEHPVWDARDPHLFEPLIYAASEALPSRQMPDSEEGRRAVDLYALGAILYHMLTGSPPFRSTDEGAILQERQGISPAVVRWPKGAEKSLPSRAIALVERLLSPDPGHRGVYESVLATLDEAVREAEGRPAAVARPEAPPPPLAPAEVAASGAARQHAPRPGPLPGASVPSGGPSFVSPQLPQRSGMHASHRSSDDRRSERISTALLIGATGIVFASAMALAAKVFLFTTPATATVPAAQNNPAPQPANGAETKSVITQLELEQEAEAARQLENFKGLRERGIAKNNATALNILDGIIRKTRSDSPVRMEAELLKGEIETALVQGGARPALPVPAANAEAEEKVYKDLVANARDLAAQQRFGAAVRTLKELPAVLKMAPYTDKAAEEAAQIEQQAKARFAELSLEADKAAADGQFARARELYQTVQARFELPSLVETAAARVKALNEAEEKAAASKAAQDAEKARAAEWSAFAATARAAAEKAASFSYQPAREELEKLAAKSTDAEVRKAAADYAKLIQDEAWFFNRCRAKLKEAIERDPKHGSPLAGYNPKGELLFEIVDFDEKGITLVTGHRAATGQRVREWSTISRTQHLETMKGVMDKDSAQEQLALAAMAFNRRVASELDARAQAADPAKQETAAKQAADLRKAQDEALGQAVQNEATARERQAAQKALQDRIAVKILGAP